MSELKDLSNLQPSTESSALLFRTSNQNQNYTQQDRPVDPTESEANILNGIKKNFRKRSCVLIISGVAVVLVVLGIVIISPSLKSASNNILRSSNILTATQNDSDIQDSLVVTTSLGSVKGVVLKSREGREYYAFYKVPYAQPPVGDLRFKSPQPATKYEGIRNETEVAPQCIQKSKYSPIIEAVGEEDCLYMNIYTPKLPSTRLDESSLMPTLYYIHGGGFTDGNGSRYGAKYFMEEDVLLITFQYRLGPFGFLSTKDGELRGNNAFKDQIMGLKWVGQNIKYFNGDPQRIMIFGNSAGAQSVSHIMVSPMGKGLYHSAITQSGGSFCIDSLIDSDKAKKTLKSLSEEVGCLNTTQKSLIECLRSKDAHELAVVRADDIVYNLMVEDYDDDESDDSVDNFMPDKPYNMLKYGDVNKVPWMVGVNSGEFVHKALGFLKDTELIETLNQNFSAEANELLQLNFDDSAAERISTNVKDFFFGNKPVSNETERNLTNLICDRTIIHCSKVQALMQAEYSDVYLYYLSKTAAKSYSDKAKIGFPPGNFDLVAHADELQFLFNYYGYPEYPADSPYFPFSRLLIKIWVQFAKTGKPYSPTGIDWETAKPGQNPTSWFELNDVPQPTTVLQSRMNFWDQFTPEDLNFV